VVALAFWASGCLSSGATDPSKVIVPKDPTGLAKCKVQKSSASPLVTEWPASEKAHLEGLLSERAVVVSYTGCEMRLLDACQVSGSYRFKRTSIASDVIEITSEDDLYAKVPLGAVSLEGELASSGRLAIKTTVSGQLRLQGGVGDLPEGDACKDATHVVSALSVGAFELVSGGGVSGRAGVEVGGAGAGVRHKKDESTLRSAGSPDSCKGTGDEPSTDCSSPIQVFLVPLDQAPHVSDAPATDAPVSDAAASDKPGDKPSAQVSEPPAEPIIPSPDPDPLPSRKQELIDRNREPPPEKSVELLFEAPEEGGRWMLLSREGERLCELPCTRRVGPKSGMKLQLDTPKKEDIKVVAVPDDLGYSPGRRVRAVPQAADNNTVAAYLFYGGILGAIGGAVWLGALQKKMDDSERPEPGGLCTREPGDASCIGSYALLGGSGLLAIATGIWWFTTSKSEELVMTLEDSDAKLELGPGTLTAYF
jgi:hypothetical protein